MSIANAARAAGYSEAYARKARPEQVAKVSMQDAFERAGLTDRQIIEHALEGLNANREIIIDGEKFGDTPDWTARHKYFTSILKLTDRVKESISSTGETRIIIIRPGETIEAKDKPLSRQVSILD